MMPGMMPGLVSLERRVAGFPDLGINLFRVRCQGFQGLGFRRCRVRCLGLLGLKAQACKGEECGL